MALVSVIVPTFNRAYCLARTLDSALAQTHADLEVLVVDDGSTDETRSLIQTRYADEPRVRYLHQENRGVAAARNHGIGMSRGDFVALLDSDDVWKPWKIELQLCCLMQFPELGMVWTDMEAIDPSGQVFDHAYIRKMYSAYALFPDGELFAESVTLRTLLPSMADIVGEARLRMGSIFSQMIMGNLVHTSTVLIRRERLEMVKGFNETLCYSGEDYDFHLRTCRYGPVGLVDMPAIQYQRGMPDRLTRREYRIHVATNFLRTITHFIDTARAEIHLPQRMINGALADAHEWIGELQFEANDIPAARRELYASIRCQWLQKRTWRLFLSCYLPDGLRTWLQLHHRQRSQPRPGPSP